MMVEERKREEREEEHFVLGGLTFRQGRRRYHDRYVKDSVLLVSPARRCPRSRWSPARTLGEREVGVRGEGGNLGRAESSPFHPSPPSIRARSLHHLSNTDHNSTLLQLSPSTQEWSKQQLTQSSQTTETRRSSSGCETDKPSSSASFPKRRRSSQSLIRLSISETVSGRVLESGRE